MNEWYNTKEGIQGSLGSFESFRKMLDARHEAYYVRKEILNYFYVLGRWSLDTCGNTMKINNGFIPKDEIPDIADVLTNNDFFQVISEYDKIHKPDVLTDEEINSKDFDWSGNTRPWPTSISSVMPTHLPTLGAKCDLCGKGWTLENCHDTISQQVIENDEPTLIYYHSQCHRIDKSVKQENRFKKIFNDAGFTNIFFETVPNEYGSNYYNLPWYKVAMPQGKIKIGWRKRVINIDYSETKVLPDFSEEKVTQGKGYIHAWGYEKAEEYLREIRKELI